MTAQLKTALGGHGCAGLCCLLVLTFLQRLSTEPWAAASPPSPPVRCLASCEAGAGRGWLGYFHISRRLQSKLSKTRLGFGLLWRREAWLIKITDSLPLRLTWCLKGWPGPQDKPSGHTAPQKGLSESRGARFWLGQEGWHNYKSKTPTRYNVTPIRMAIINNNNRNKNRTNKTPRK